MRRQAAPATIPARDALSHLVVVVIEGESAGHPATDGLSPPQRAVHLRFHSQIPIGPFTSQYGHCFGRDEDGTEDGAVEMAPVPVPTEKGGGGGELEDGVAAPEPELLHVKSQWLESQ